jgi:hypothetical protein
MHSRSSCQWVCVPRWPMSLVHWHARGEDLESTEGATEDPTCQWGLALKSCHLKAKYKLRHEDYKC